MPRVPRGAPLSEQGSRLLGIMDLAAGRYPGFLFGLSVGRLVPVFHFHESTADALEPALRYLAENNYRTITSDVLAAFVRGGPHPGPRTVMLCFDDALASLWIVVAPLLRRFGLTAVTYAIPGRMADATGTRRTLDDGHVDAAAADTAANPFVTWPELKALSDSGVIDVQSHTRTHAMMFADDQVIDVVTPEYGHEHFMNRPTIGADGSADFLAPTRYGHPLFGCRSRMSDGRRFYPDPEACARAEAFVNDRGGRGYFDHPNWREDMKPVLSQVKGRFERDDDRAQAIARELADARDTLQTHLGTRVSHVCLPWGITGQVTRAALDRLGFSTAFANRRPGRMAVASGDDPFYLKRLHGRHVFALPGRGRRVFVTLA